MLKDVRVVYYCGVNSFLYRQLDCLTFQPEILAKNSFAAAPSQIGLFLFRQLIFTKTC